MSTLRRIAPDRLDLYTLRHLAGPFAFVLAALLLAQLLERLLRLFDLTAATGAALSIDVGAAALIIITAWQGLTLAWHAARTVWLGFLSRPEAS